VVKNLFRPSVGEGGSVLMTPSVLLLPSQLLALVEHSCTHTGSYVRRRIPRMSVAGIEGHAVLLGANTHTCTHSNRLLYNFSLLELLLHPLLIFITHLHDRLAYNGTEKRITRSSYT
jgi:hypothetical protein